MNINSNVSKKIKQLYQITNELESLYPGRKFTPDGHTVGSIGEVIAAEKYKLTLLPNSTAVHDAVSADGRKVQIKATQINKILISSKPDYLIVLHISPDGQCEEIYNGPGNIPWQHAGKRQKTGQRSLSLKLLKSLMDSVPQKEKISTNS